MGETSWYGLTENEVLEKLDTSLAGLSTSEIAEELSDMVRMSCLPGSG
jgi:hypothetical protein